MSGREICSHSAHSALAALEENANSTGLKDEEIGLTSSIEPIVNISTGDIVKENLAVKQKDFSEATSVVEKKATVHEVNEKSGGEL